MYFLFIYLNKYLTNRTGFPGCSICIYLEITFTFNCTTKKPKGKQSKGASLNTNCVHKNS